MFRARLSHTNQRSKICSKCICVTPRLNRQEPSEDARLGASWPHCERVLYHHRAILLILRVHRDLLLGGSDHMEDEQNKRGEEIGQDVETLEREEEINGWRDNERSDT